MQLHRLEKLVAAAAIAALATTTSCARDGSMTSPGIMSPLRISADVSNTPISTLVISVSASDIASSLVFNVKAGADGKVSTTIDVPPGLARLFTAQGFDGNGNITHEGSTTMDVARGNNPTITITLRPKAGQVKVNLTVGSVSLTNSVAELHLVAGGATGAITARALDETNTDIAGATILWGSSNPAVATVDGTGVVTPLSAGTATIVSTYDGVAATTSLTVVPGNVIVFARAGLGIVAINSDGTNLHQIGLPGDQEPAWSPDHRKIAFHSPAAAGIWVMDADGSNRTQLSFDPSDRLPSWSPDGKSIAFIRTGGSQSAIYLMDSDGKNAFMFIGSSDGTSPLAWAPDGDPRNDTGFAFVDIKGLWARQGQTQVGPLAGVYFPSWSPDGSKLLIEYTGGIGWLNPDLTGGSQLTAAEPPDQPVWSPNGKQIAFTGNTGIVNQTGIWLMNPDGTGMVQLTSGALDGNPSWR